MHDGWGGSALLDSYDRERRPIANTNVAASTQYFRRLRSVFPTGLPFSSAAEAGAAARAEFAAAFERTKREELLYISEQIVLSAVAFNREALHAEAAQRGIPLRILDLPSSEALDVYEQPLVLVRPDGHITWRGPALPPDLGALLDQARGALTKAAASIPV